MSEPQPDETVTKEEAKHYLEICKNGYDKCLGNSNLRGAREFRDEMIFWHNFIQKKYERETEQASRSPDDKGQE
jgi:hypothetical protein